MGCLLFFLFVLFMLSIIFSINSILALLEERSFKLLFYTSLSILFIFITAYANAALASMAGI